ncbi:galactofuranosyltransferase lpg1-like protein [Novymonas esmeraldas]|uniref:Galactofuranosyltransferase lpg1-like protein n=1 Tax=Novymonas esmeraldas TaxID=1808958 RepID=A0AAW0F727_9TRYP
MQPRFRPLRRGWRVTRRLRRQRLLKGACIVIGLVLLCFVLPHALSSKTDVHVEHSTTTAMPHAEDTVTSTALPTTTTTTTATTATTTTTTTLEVVPLRTLSAEPTRTVAHHTPGVASPDDVRSRYATELALLDVYDVFPLRPGEHRVSFAEFADCLGARLSVDPHRGVEAARDDLASDKYAPFLISVTLENTQDVKALLCNLTMPYRYVVLAQNGDTPEATTFFHLLRRVFAFTRRLTVLQFPQNIGFAGAVNAGLREALAHPVHEVPFVHIVHNDVRFRNDALLTSVEAAYAATVGDASVIAALEQEVATEPNAHTPLIRRPGGLRAPLHHGSPLPQQRPDTPVFVTSALLPDRLRYTSPLMRRMHMQGRVSFLFDNSRGYYTSVHLTRLAALTVGFFDENFFPILYEDTDYRWRAHLLGFTERFQDTARDDDFISFDLDCASARVNKHADGDGGDVGGGGGAGAGALDGTKPGAIEAGPTLSPEGKALRRQCPKAFYAGVQFTYMQQKWGVKEMAELMSPRTSLEPYSSDAFDGMRRLPLDAWVVDTTRLDRLRQWLRDLGREVLDVDNYDPNIILRAVTNTST